MLQPGRFLNPGQIADPSLLWFCPMPFAIGAHAREGSMAALMEARFDVYKRTVVQPFFTQLARGVDRQIVLVDVLRALNAGQAAFADQRLAFETILPAFRFGRRNILRLLFGARIDRVSCRDQTDPCRPRRDHLQRCVLLEVPTLRAEAAHARVAATALASIRCTEDGAGVIDGHKVDVVIGLAGPSAHPLLPDCAVTPPPRVLGRRFEFPVFSAAHCAAAGDGLPISISTRRSIFCWVTSS